MKDITPIAGCYVFPSDVMVFVVVNIISGEEQSVGHHPLCANTEGVVAFPSVTALSWCRASKASDVRII